MLSQLAKIPTINSPKLQHEKSLYKNHQISEGNWAIKQNFGYWKYGIKTVNRNFESSIWCMWMLHYIQGQIQGFLRLSGWSGFFNVSNWRRLLALHGWFLRKTLSNNGGIKDFWTFWGTFHGHTNRQPLCDFIWIWRWIPLLSVNVTAYSIERYWKATISWSQRKIVQKAQVTWSK